MARRSNTLRRRARVVGAVGLALAAVAAGCSSPQSSTGAPDGDAGTDRVLVCESGTVTRGDVHTSSAVVTRFSEGTAVPPGCRLA